MNCGLKIYGTVYPLGPSHGRPSACDASFQRYGRFFVIIGPVWPFNKRHGAEMDDVNASTEEGAAGRKGHECS